MTKSICRIYWSLLCPTAHSLEQERPLQWEACAPQLDSSPCLLQQDEKPVQQWTPRTAKNKIKILKKIKLPMLLLSRFSCVWLCDPIDGSPPGSPVPGILQARTLEWVAFSNAWKWKVKVKSLSRVQFFVTPWTAAHQAPPSMGFSRQEYWSGVPLPSPELLWEPPNFFKIQSIVVILN